MIEHDRKRDLTEAPRDRRQGFLRTQFLPMALAAGLLLSGCRGQEAPGPTPAARTIDSPARAIVLISLDTLRADFLNIDGYTDFVTSPTLDTLGSENYYFENSIVSEPWTLTSHMSLLTGLYPHRHGVNEEVVLSEGVVTLAERLADMGYRTQAFVDGGYVNSRWGFGRGFEEYVDVKRKGLRRVLPRATRWLEQHREDRLFLFLHTYDVHSRGDVPYYAPPPSHRGIFTEGLESRLATFGYEEFKARFDALEDDLRDEDVRYLRARYAEGVRYVDDQLATFFESLRELGLYDDALIIVWSDHGEGLFSHEVFAHGEVFDHTIRAPLIVKAPRQFGGQGRISSVVSSVDVLPTVIEFAGGSGPEGLDGRSLVPLLDGKPREGIAFSVRMKHGRGLFSARSDRHHLIFDALSGERLFFDLAEDPLEMRNLFPSGLEEEVRLTRALRDFVAEYTRVMDERIVEESGPMATELERQLRALGYLE